LHDSTVKDISIVSGNHFEITQDVIENVDYSLQVQCTANGAHPKGAVADVTFIGRDGKVLPKPYPGMESSKGFGAYFYVKTESSRSAEPNRYKFRTPDRAAQISIKIHAFNVEIVTLAGNYALDPAEQLVEGNAERSDYIEYFQSLLSEARSIPDSNGSEYFTKHHLRVGIISDVYMYNFYKDVFSHVYYLSPSNYNEFLSQDLDVIIYTTCWKGIDNDEWRGVKYRENPKTALDSILHYARMNDIKTVFQSIEDPSNFDYFLPIAKKFDYVLTTDTDCIDRYKTELGHHRVFYGEYGVNPQFNNPIGCRRNIRNAAFFAGSYPERYKERCADMAVIFDSIIDAGGDLLIADRNYGAESKDLAYPARFQRNVLPPVQHDLLQKVHKLFRHNLNFNSIKQSPTMCAMRVYELQAQGNGLLSNYAKSVFNRFPGVRTIPYKQELKFDFSVNESWEEYQINMRNARQVLDEKTSYQVVSKLLENIGLPCAEKHDTTIAVICRRKSDAILRSFECQAYSDKILVEESELNEWDTIKRRHRVGYFCWFSDENDYQRFYLNDLLNGFKYTDCRYITKNAHFDKHGLYVDGKQHEFTSKCSSKELSLFTAKYLDPGDVIEHPMNECFDLDGGYSIDPFEVNFSRYMKLQSPISSDYRLSVIVPVYNNGRFLLSKCIASLRRNVLWHQMEILLIDDGTTDQETVSALEYLSSTYANVKVKFNYDGGSGSASRPRNQGIDMASAPLVTFLDPDNEIGPGSYDQLVELYNEANEASSERVEFVSGFHVKVDEGVRVIGRHTSQRISIITKPKKVYFEKGKFPVVATQSAVISRAFLVDNNIRFVEGSAGQDTLFGWEILAKAAYGAFSGEAYIIYYADRSDSITNEVTKGYFQKKYILEKEQVEFLRRNGVIDQFKDGHFDNFMSNWYLKKLDKVAPDDYRDSVTIIGNICRLYDRDPNEYIKVSETKEAAVQAF